MTDAQAGIVAEMVDDTMEMLDDDAEEIDEEADQEVDKVLWELTEGKLGQTGKVGTSLPVRLPSLIYVDFATPINAQTPATPVAEEEDDEAETERMQKQLDSLLRG